MNDLVQDNFKGVISIEEHGKWIFKQAYGESDLANQRMNRLDTKFHGISKQDFYRRCDFTIN